MLALLGLQSHSMIGFRLPNTLVADLAKKSLLWWHAEASSVKHKGHADK